MQSLTIRLPDELLAKAEARAAEAGHASVDEYLAALVTLDARGDAEAAVDPLSPVGDAEMEALLLRRMERTDRDIKGSPFGTIPVPPRPIGPSAGGFHLPEAFDTSLPPEEFPRFD